MKTLFLKSNLLHIRTNEGEFEVSNPEEFEAAWIPLGVTIEQYFKSFEGTDHSEWPGEVEIKCTKNCRTGADCDEIQGCNLVARLLPKEEKKHEWTTDDIMSMVEKKPAQPTPNFPKGGTTFTESAYKEFEGKDLHIVTPESPEPQEKGHDCEFFLVTDVSVYACECDPHHILIDNQEYVAINKITKANPVSAPSESQEEMWNEVNEHINAQIGDYISLEAVKLSFILTRKPE